MAIFMTFDELKLESDQTAGATFKCKFSVGFVFKLKVRILQIPGIGYIGQ